MSKTCCVVYATGRLCKAPAVEGTSWCKKHAGMAQTVKDHEKAAVNAGWMKKVKNG